MRKPCELITIIPCALETEWAESLVELIQPFKPAALILQLPSTGALANLTANAQAAELAVLFVDAVHQTREMGANGVYLSTPGSGGLQRSQQNLALPQSLVRLAVSAGMWRWKLQRPARLLPSMHPLPKT